MAEKFEPQRTTLEGVEVVMLAPEHYERLAAYRRQLGGQSRQLRSLKQALDEVNALLDEIEGRLADSDGSVSEGRSLRADLAELLRTRPELRWRG